MRSIEAKDLGKIAVIMGGESAEREVSLMSGEGVYNALKDAGCDCFKFDPKERSPFELSEEKPDRAFLILHGKGGEDGVIQGVLEYMKLPYTGSGVTASAVGMDKTLTKRVWASAGIPVPRGTVLKNKADCSGAIKELGCDLIIKPSREGSSIGLYKLKGAGLRDLEEAFDKASQSGMEVMCEEYVFGRELTVAVLDQGTGLRALPVIEIKAPSGDYDFEHKYYSDDTVYECPAALPADLAEQIQKTVLQAAELVGAKGWARIDVMLREDGSFVLLEINTAPGMTPHSLVPLAAKTAGIPYGELVRIVAAGASLKG